VSRSARAARAPGAATAQQGRYRGPPRGVDPADRQQPPARPWEVTTRPTGPERTTRAGCTSLDGGAAPGGSRKPAGPDPGGEGAGLTARAVAGATEPSAIASFDRAVGEARTQMAALASATASRDRLLAVTAAARSAAALPFRRRPRTPLAHRGSQGRLRRRDPRWAERWASLCDGYPMGVAVSERRACQPSERDVPAAGLDSSLRISWILRDSPSRLLDHLGLAKLLEHAQRLTPHLQPSSTPPRSTSASAIFPSTTARSRRSPIRSQTGSSSSRQICSASSSAPRRASASAIFPSV